MSALPARAAAAGALALALALALPAAAFADDEERGRSASAQQSNDERRDQQARGEQDRGEQGRSSQEARDDAGRSAEGRAAGGDPRGNNGTVKIDGEEFDDGRGNEPHVGCTFQVDFYGFDAGDTAAITLTGQAPTGGGLLHSETATPISSDAAGGGQDRDATLTYSVDDQLSELRSIAPHPQQGWHVKLAVDVDGAPGGAKQKVFWIDCPTVASTGGATTESVSPAGAPAVDTVDAQSLGAATAIALPTAVSGTTVASAVRQDELTLGSGTATLASGAAQAAPAQGVAARGAAAPSALPFTGPQSLAYLLALGAGAVVVGAAAHRLGRTRAELG